MVDVVIIGAGVTGSAIARELSRRERTILVLEKGLDVCEGTTKANSGIAHAGFDAKPGTLKARMNVRGSRMMEELSKQLDFPYVRNGSLVLAFAKEDENTLQELYDKGEANGVEGLRLISGDEARELEPNLSGQVTAALHAPTGGIVDPFLLNVALAENAYVNGVEFRFGHEVTAVERIFAQEGTEEPAKAHYRITVRTLPGARCERAGEAANGCGAGKEFVIEAGCVVNAAGVYADELHNMVSEKKLHITPRRGQYMLMDKVTAGFVHATVFQCPTKMGKGVLVTPTCHGNLLIGPDSEDIENKEGTNTSAAALDYVLRTAGLSADRIPSRQVITSFAGLRAHEDGGDFILREAEDAPDFFDAAGIESPGLTSAPAIGEYMAQLINEKHPAEEKENFIKTRKGTPCMAQADGAARAALIAENPAFANVICRCELVTEGEIVDAVTRPLGARTLDGIKRRVRAGMGRCQAGFCSPKQMDILSRETGIPLDEICKSGGGSRFLVGDTDKAAGQGMTDSGEVRA